MTPKQSKDVDSSTTILSKYDDIARIVKPYGLYPDQMIERIVKYIDTLPENKLHYSGKFNEKTLTRPNTVSPTPSSLREQILLFVQGQNVGFPDHTNEIDEEATAQLEALVASYIEAAEIDRAIKEVEKIYYNRKINPDDDGVVARALKAQLHPLQAQKAVLEEK